MRCEKAEGEKLRLSDSKLISGPAVNRPSVSAFIEGKACCAWYYRACGTSWVFLSPFSLTHTHTHCAHTRTHAHPQRERGGERAREREFPVQNTSTHIQPGDKLSRIISLSRAEGGVFCRLTRDGERENILLNDIPEVY